MRALRIVFVFFMCFISTLSASGNGEKKAQDVSQAAGAQAAPLIVVPGNGSDFYIRMKSQAAKTDWEIAGLKGKVESLSTEVATPVQGVSARWINQTGTWNYGQTYDSRGRLVEDIYSDDISPEPNGMQKTVYTYTDDEKGNRTGMTGSSSNGAGFMRQYTYDSNESLSEMVSYSPDGSLIGKTAFEYDEKVNQIETTTYNTDGSIFGTSMISFDKNGRKTGVVQHVYDKSPYNNAAYANTTYTFDDSRTKIDTTWYDLKDVPYEGWVRVLDNIGNLIEESMYRNGVLLRKTVPIYNYDQRGNWVLRIDQTIVISKGTTSNEPPTVHYRTIEYWD